MIALDRQREDSLEGDILASRGSWHTGQSLKSIFSTYYNDLPRHHKWRMSISRYPSTVERRLVAGIRDLCILSSQKTYLEENEKEKLTREVLSVLMVAQK